MGRRARLLALDGLLSALGLAACALAAYRITRLVVTDTLVVRQRTAVLAWLLERGHDKVVEGLTCPWCVGVWASAAVALLWWAGGPLRAVVWVAAVAGGQALLSLHEARST